MARTKQHDTNGGGSGGGGAGVRLQRVLAEMGVASRRASEALIEGGEVEVNGKLVTTLPVFVDPSADRIVVQGRVLPKKAGAVKQATRKIYVMLNKPERTISSADDEKDGGRRTVVDMVDHPSSARLYPVGRLDYDTRGLVLLTNDGELANRLTHPRYGVHKTYRAVVKGKVDPEQIAEMEEGIFLAERKEGRTVGAKRTARAELSIVRADRERTTLEITLAEGRNRQVRRMLAKVGHPVKRLTRVKMGPLELKGVASGQWRELTRQEVRSLRRACGLEKKRTKAENGKGSV